MGEGKGGVWLENGGRLLDKEIFHCTFVTTDVYSPANLTSPAFFELWADYCFFLYKSPVFFLAIKTFGFLGIQNFRCFFPKNNIFLGY